jgi:hypothetical protein
MTATEARERALRIWKSPAFDLFSRANGSWEVDFLTPVQGGLWHCLDVNGHATCHKVCEKLEAAYCGEEKRR